MFFSSSSCLTEELDRAAIGHVSFLAGVHVGEIAFEDMTAAAILKEITDPFDETGLHEGQMA